jgi:lipoprotein-anchoring transpeptidase ErfK/SrfK
LAITVALTSVVAMLWYSDWILPGVQVFDVDLGSQTTSEANAALINYWRRQEITLDAEGTTLVVPPESLGMTFDVDATVQLAHHQGRSLATLERAIRSQGRIVVPPVWMFDPKSAETNLRSMAPQFDKAPSDAELAIVNGQVIVSEPQNGRRLDVTATTEKLLQNPAEVISSGRLGLVIAPVSPTVTDVSPIVAEVERLLSTTASVHLYDPVTDQSVDWLVSPDVWSNWLDLEIIAPELGEYQWNLDTDQARAYLLTQVQTLGADRYLDWETAVNGLYQAISSQNPDVNLRVYHHPTQHIVQPGDTFANIGRAYGIPYPWIQQANPTSNERLSVGQVLTIPSPDELLPLPVVGNKRIIVSISQQRMWAYENGQEKWAWLASTGIDESPTAPGIFQIQSHETNAYAGNWDLWMPNFMGIYRPVPTSDFMNGFHGFPTRDGANLLWTGNLGQKVTYGCILISNTNAVQLYEWAEPGVVVEVRN